MSSRFKSERNSASPRRVGHGRLVDLQRQRLVGPVLPAAAPARAQPRLGQLARMRVEEQVRRRGQRPARLHPFPAEHRAQLDFQVQLRGDAEHLLAAIPGRTAGCGPAPRRPTICAAVERDDRLEEGRHGALGHQLVEQHQGQRLVAGAFLQRCAGCPPSIACGRGRACWRTAPGRLRASATGSCHAAAVDVRAVGAAQVAEHQRAADLEISACTAGDRLARQRQVQILPPPDREGQRVERQVAHRLRAVERADEEPHGAGGGRRKLRP